MALSVKPALLLLLFCAALAQAQGTATSINDPTRPPASFVATPTTVTGVTEAGGRLRSVKIPRRGGRPTAVIDGQVVRLGQKLGEARLVRLTETEAVLESAAGRETLRLTPDVIKKPVLTKVTRPRKKEMP